MTAQAWLVEHVLGHEPALRGYLARFLANAADVADVIQDTYAKLLALGDTERRRISSPQAYLFATARHLALDRLRHARMVNRSTLTELAARDVLTTPAPEQEVNAAQERALLAHAIAALPARCREVLTLRKLHGLSQKEIARRLNMAEHTVESHIAHGVRACAEFVRKARRS